MYSATSEILAAGAIRVAPAARVNAYFLRSRLATDAFCFIRRPGSDSKLYNRETEFVVRKEYSLAHASSSSPGVVILISALRPTRFKDIQRSSASLRTTLDARGKPTVASAANVLNVHVCFGDSRRARMTREETGANTRRIGRAGTRSGCRPIRSTYACSRSSHAFPAKSKKPMPSAFAKSWAFGLMYGTMRSG